MKKQGCNAMADRNFYIFRRIFVILLFQITLYSGIYSCSAKEDPVEVGAPEKEEVKPINSSEIKTPYAFFTDPQKISSGSASTVIMDKLIAYIDATPDESSIHMSIFLFEYKPVLSALKRAHSRNVGLHIMADGSSRSSNNGMLNELRDLDENIEIITIKNDASSIAINHNKFVLFSAIATKEGETKEVIFQTSHNFVKSGMRKLQDAQVLSDPGIYNAYYEYWKKMRALGEGGMKNFVYTEYSDPAANIELYFYPKRENGEIFGEDTVIELLNKITEPKATTITIGMSDWADSRAHIIDKLNELLLQGATIEVITKSGKGAAINEGLRMLKENGAYIKMFNMEGTDPPKINIHLKVMMIEGVVNGEETNMVMTGTQNFTNNAIWNNNEVTLLFHNHDFFGLYKDYFAELKELSGIEIPQ